MRGPNRSGSARSNPVAPALPPFDIVVTDLALSGEAYAEVKGETIYVDGAIPGEKVRVRIVDRAEDGVAKAALLEVLEPSPHRVRPACPHAALCGGCSFQHVAYDEQLRQKTHLLDGLLEALAGPSPYQGGLGEHLAIGERLVVTASPGVFRRSTGHALGDRVAPGDEVGTVGGAPVRSAFGGRFAGFLAIEGERVTPSQPVAWLSVDGNR